MTVDEMNICLQSFTSEAEQVPGFTHIEDKGKLKRSIAIRKTIHGCNVEYKLTLEITRFKNESQIRVVMSPHVTSLNSDLSINNTEKLNVWRCLFNSIVSTAPILTNTDTKPSDVAETARQIAECLDKVSTYDDDFLVRNAIKMNILMLDATKEYEQDAWHKCQHIIVSLTQYIDDLRQSADAMFNDPFRFSQFYDEYLRTWSNIPTMFRTYCNELATLVSAVSKHLLSGEPLL